MFVYLSFLLKIYQFLMRYNLIILTNDLQAKSIKIINVFHSDRFGSLPFATTPKQYLKTLPMLFVHYYPYRPFSYTIWHLILLVYKLDPFIYMFLTIWMGLKFMSNIPIYLDQISQIIFEQHPIFFEPLVWDWPFLVVD